MKNKLRRRLLTLLACLSLAVPIGVAGSVALSPAPPAQAGTFTQVCNSSFSKPGTFILISYSATSQLIMVYPGQCKQGVWGVADYLPNCFTMTDYGRICANGEFRTPLNKTYVVTVH